MDGFKFNFDFNVNKSPLFELGNQLDNLAKRLDTIEAQSKKLEDAFDRWRLPDFMAAFSGLSGVLSSITSAVSGLVTGAIKGAVSFASMALDAASMRESSLATFEAMYENKDVAAEVFKSALRIAKDTKFETDQVVDRFKALASGGYKAKELTNVFLAISDVDSATGKGLRAQNALVKMRLTGVASQATVRSLAESGAGSEIYTNIADSLGISTSKSASDRKQEVLAALTQKKVSDLVAGGAFIDAVNVKLNKGLGVGHYSKDMGIKTIEGQLSTLKSSVTDIIAGINIDENSGIGKFKKFLGDLNEQISGTDQNGNLNENAMRFQNLIKNLVDDVFILFDVKGGTTKDMFTNVLSIAEKLEVKFRGLMEWIRDTLLPFITDKVIPYIVGIFENPDGFLSGIKAALIDLARLVGKELYKGVKDAIFGEDKGEVTEYSGRGQPLKIPKYTGRPLQLSDFPEDPFRPSPFGKLTDNMINGLKQGVGPKATEVGVELGQSVTDGTNKATDSHSPSRVFEKIGMNLVDGLDIGIKKGNSKIERSLSQLVEMPNDQQVMRTKDISIDNVSIHIDGAQEPNLIANEVIRVLKDIGRYSMAPNGLVR